MPCRVPLFLWLTAGCLAGCDFPGSRFLLRDYFPAREGEVSLDASRQKFIQERDPEAFRWLLTHALENTMTVAEVDRVLGDMGERMERDAALKSQRGDILQTDVAWKWGPDSEGHSVVLFFREGRLINYRPKDYAALGMTSP